MPKFSDPNDPDTQNSRRWRTELPPPIFQSALGQPCPRRCQRQVARDALPVDPKFADSAPGKILQGIGGLSTLPLYGTPLGLPPPLARFTSRASTTTPRPVNARAFPSIGTQADLAAKTYLVTAAPAEVLLDKLIVGKILKGSVRKKELGS